MASELDARLAELAAPIHAELERINTELGAVELKRATLKEDQSRVEQILRRLNGTYTKPGRKPVGKKRNSPRPGAAVMELVAGFLRTWPDRESFTAPALHRALKAARKSVISHDTTHRAVLALHEDHALQLVATDGGQNHNARVYRYLGPE